MRREAEDADVGEVVARSWSGFLTAPPPLSHFAYIKNVFAFYCCFTFPQRGLFLYPLYFWMESIKFSCVHLPAVPHKRGSSHCSKRRAHARDESFFFLIQMFRAGRQHEGNVHTVHCSGAKTKLICIVQDLLLPSLSSNRRGRSSVFRPLLLTLSPTLLPAAPVVPLNCFTKTLIDGAVKSASLGGNDC